jgi:hypothetical protein
MKPRVLFRIALVVLAISLAGLAGKWAFRAQSLGNSASRPTSVPTPAPQPVAPIATPTSPTTVAAVDDNAITNRLFLTPESFWASPIAERSFAAFHDWAEQYLSSLPAGKAALEGEGTELARARREDLRALIESNPERALELAVPVRVRAGLPAAVEALLEERFSSQGRLAVLGALAEPGKENEVAPIFRVATVGEREFNAFVFGRRLGEPTRDHIPLHGIAVDDKAAISENPLRILEPAEAAAATARASEPICSVSRLPSTSFGQQVAADTGSGPVFFCHLSHAVQANENLVAGESGPPSPAGSGTPEASTWTEGSKKVILIRVDFPDLAGQPFADATGISLLSGLDAFYTEMSYGRAGFYTNGAGSDLTPTFRMPQPAGYYGTNNYYDQLRADARSAATAAGYTLANYDRDVICMGGVPGFGWSGLAYVGAAGAWLRSSFTTGVAGHELGHNWGLNHANYWDTSGQSVTGPGTSVEYGDVFDTMGSASAGNNHFNARYKAYLNWLTTNDWQTVTTNGTYRIYAHDNQNSAGLRALRIVKNAGTNYWVEFRQKFSGNKWLMSGAGLRWAQNGNEKSHLLDTTAGSVDGKNDSAIVIGRTYSDTVSGIHITPIGKGGTTPESLDVVVNLGSFPGNLPPTLTVTSSATNAATGVALSFNATASDPNGDTLAYYWDFGDGNFGTNGPSQIKSWSSAGDYVVRCVLTDMKGGVASASVLVTIGAPTTFRIAGQIALTNGLLQGARVYVSTTRMAWTDSDGTYNIVGLPAGTYTVGAILENYALNATFTNPVIVGPHFSGANFQANYSVLTAPTINSQPLSQTVSLGSNVTFTVAASGSTPMSYQWRFNAANIAGGTSSSYTKNNAQATNAGSYSVVVSNLAGTATSANAVLTVNTPPSITGQPQSQSVIAGNNATFTVAASGASPFSYQWRFTGTNIPGATASAYTRNNVQLQDGGSYTVVVTNSLGLATSAPAALTVNFTLAATATYGGRVTNSPSLQSYPANSLVTLTATSVSVFPFAGWSGDASGTNNPLSVVMNSNKTITANFTSPVPDLIIDNPFATFTGTWTTASSATDKYGSDYKTAGTSPSGVTATAAFRPNIPTAGTYDVYVWFPTITKGLLGAQFVLTDANGSITNSVNESTGSSGWQLLAGARNFAQGTNGFVLLNNNGNTSKNVVADAVRWVYSETQVVVSNHAPVLVARPNQIIYAGTMLRVTNAATDADSPNQNLTFGLGPQAPAGASINATNGVLSWKPGLGAANTTNTVSVRVSDDGTPSLSATNTFTVAVLPPLSISSIASSNGSITVNWLAISGRTYQVQYKTSLSDTNWSALLPDITATGATASKTDPATGQSRFYRILLY